MIHLIHFLHICTVNESAVFTVDPITSFLTIFGQDPRSDPDESLKTTAKQVKFRVEFFFKKMTCV